jgi:hypothetical protein
MPGVTIGQPWIETMAMRFIEGMFVGIGGGAAIG